MTSSHISCHGPPAVPASRSREGAAGPATQTTTSSPFSLQTLALFQAGESGRAIANVLLSVLFCLLSVWLGYMVPAFLFHGGRN